MHALILAPPERAGLSLGPWIGRAPFSFPIATLTKHLPCCQSAERLRCRARTVPGQRLDVNTETGSGHLAEPVQVDEIDRLDRDLPPREEAPNAHAPCELRRAGAAEPYSRAPPARSCSTKAIRTTGGSAT